MHTAVWNAVVLNQSLVRVDATSLNLCKYTIILILNPSCFSISEHFCNAPLHLHLFSWLCFETFWINIKKVNTKIVFIHLHIFNLHIKSLKLQIKRKKRNTLNKKCFLYSEMEKLSIKEMWWSPVETNSSWHWQNIWLKCHWRDEDLCEVMRRQSPSSQWNILSCCSCCPLTGALSITSLYRLLRKDLVEPGWRISINCSQPLPST